MQNEPVTGQGGTITNPSHGNMQAGSDSPQDFPTAIELLEHRIGETRALASQLVRVLGLKPLTEKSDRALSFRADNGAKEMSSLIEYIRDLNTLSARLHSCNEGLDNALRELYKVTGQVASKQESS